MTTDRELLEAARKAAGISGGTWDGRVYSNASGNDTWAPLDDDGDALRLAVKLRMTIHRHDPAAVCYFIEHCFCLLCHH